MRALPRSLSLLVAAALTAGGCVGDNPAAPRAGRIAASDVSGENNPGPPDSPGLLALATALNTQVSGIAGRLVDILGMNPGPPDDPSLVPLLGTLATQLDGVQGQLVGHNPGPPEINPGPPDAQVTEQLLEIAATAGTIVRVTTEQSPGPPDVRAALDGVAAAATGVATAALELLRQ